jgi:hypothetical protein
MDNVSFVAIAGVKNKMQQSEMIATIIYALINVLLH